MDTFAVIRGLLSSVPAAMQAWEMIAPHIQPKLHIPDEDQAKIAATVEVAHQEVEVWHKILASQNPAAAVVQVAKEPSPFKEGQ